VDKAIDPSCKRIPNKMVSSSWSMEDI